MKEIKDDTQMEKYIMFMDQKDRYSENEYTTQSNLQIQCNPYQATLVAQTVKRLVYNAGDLGSIPELRRSTREGNGNPLQYSCLENPMDGVAWQATVHGS